MSKEKLAYYGAGAVLSIGGYIAIDGHAVHADETSNDLPVNPEELVVEVENQDPAAVPNEQEPIDEAPITDEDERQEVEEVITDTEIIEIGGIEVVNPSGPSEKDAAAEETAETLEMVVDASKPPKHTRRSEFKNLPFSTPQDAKQSISGQSKPTRVLDKAAAAVQNFIAPSEPEEELVIRPEAQSSQEPIEITTNAPATISIDESGVHVEVSADIDTSVSVPVEEEATTEPVIPEADQVETPTPPVQLPIESSNPQPDAQETIDSSSYRAYLNTRPVLPEPAHLTELRNQTDSLEPGVKNGVLSPHYKDYNNWLFSSFTPTVEGYKTFLESGISTEFTNAFDDEKTIINGETINPSCLVVHWMAGRPKDIPTFAAQMRYGVQYATDGNGMIYQTTPIPNSRTYHAAGANDDCVGVEVYGDGLFDWSPDTVETLVYWVTQQGQERGIPIVRDLEAIEASPIDRYGDYVADSSILDQATLLGHKEVDRTRAEHPKGKVDPPTFTINEIYRMHLELVAQLQGAEQPPAETASFVNPAVTTSTAESSPAVVAETGVTADKVVVSALKQLRDMPVLSADQVALLGRSYQEGFTLVRDDEALISSPAVEPINVSPEPVVTEPVVTPSVAEEEDPEDNSDKIEHLLSTEFTAIGTITPDEAVRRSGQSKMNGGTLSMEEAYGPHIPMADMYIAFRGEGDDPLEAAVQTATATRETDRRAWAVGDLGEHPSYGPSQMRDIGNDPDRDPQANLIPKEAIENSSNVYNKSGMGPWEVVLPDELTVEKLGNAISLEKRDMGNRRAEFENRMDKIAQEVLAMQVVTEPLVAAALGEEA